MNYPVLESLGVDVSKFPYKIYLDLPVGSGSKWKQMVNWCEEEFGLASYFEKNTWFAVDNFSGSAYFIFKNEEDFVKFVLRWA